MGTAKINARMGDLAPAVVARLGYTPDTLDSLVAKYIKEHAEASYFLEYLEPGFAGPCNDESSWRSEENDMREMSQQFPGVLFTLSGEGEDSPDYWIAYYLDGKRQKVKGEVVYPMMDTDWSKFE